MADFESLEAIAQSDALLDAIAGERRFTPGDSDEQALAALLEGWRDGVRRPPIDHILSEDEATTALQRGRVQGPETSRRADKSARRGLTLVASTAAAVLAIGGFGAVVAGSGPGDSLYGLKTALFGEKTSVRDDKVALAAQTEMAQVKQLIDNGDWDQAQQKLAAVSTQVQSVDDVGTKTDLIQQWNELSVKVGTRDAAATLPSAAPGEPAAPPPPGVTLMELPAVTTTTETTTSPATTTSTDGTSVTSTSPTTSGEPTTTTSGEPTTTTSGESATSTTPSAATSTTSSAAAAATTSAAPTTTAAATTTTTAAAPTTTTSAAPSTTASTKVETTASTTSSQPAAAATSLATTATTTVAPTTTTTTTVAPTTAATTTAAPTTTTVPGAAGVSP